MDSLRTKKKLFGFVYTHESTTTQPLVMCERNSEQVQSFLILTVVWTDWLGYRSDKECSWDCSKLNTKFSGLPLSVSRDVCSKGVIAERVHDVNEISELHFLHVVTMKGYLLPQ